MKSFEYAKNKKKARMPVIKIRDWEIVLWAIPLAPFVIIPDMVNDWYYKQLKWSEEKANRALDHFLPYVLNYVEEENAYYYCLDWHFSGSEIARKVPFGMKKWTKKFSYEILNHLQYKYENINFTKIIEKDFDETWLRFEKKA